MKVDLDIAQTAGLSQRVERVSNRQRRELIYDNLRLSLSLSRIENNKKMQTFALPNFLRISLMG